MSFFRHSIDMREYRAFVTHGPLIATLLVILYSHLWAWFTYDWNDHIRLKAVLGMFILAIPTTAVAYVVGLIPAALTALVYRDLMHRDLMCSYSSQIRSAVLGGLAGALLLIAALVFLINFGLAACWYLPFVLLVMVLTSICCAYPNSMQHAPNCLEHPLKSA